MAKVSAPFLSLDASGTVASTLTASKWKGRNYMRLRIVPANPQSPNQQLTRGYLGAIGKAAHAVLTSFTDSVHVGSPFFTAARDGAPSGQSWISWLQMILHSLVSALNTTYTALSGTETGRYDDAGDTLNLFDYVTVGDTPVTYTKGFQVYLLAVFATSYLGYTGFSGGVDAATVLELTAFTTWVGSTTP